MPRSFRDEGVVEAGMLFHSGTSLSTVVAGKVVSVHIDVTFRIVSFVVGKQSDVVRGVARSGTPGQLLAIAHAQCSIHLGFLRATTVVERRFDAMPTGRPLWPASQEHAMPDDELQRASESGRQAP